MILELIFEKQRRLDKHFKDNPEVLKNYHFDKKVIALYVEIAEFLNEIEVFKYWKMNKRFDKQKILEEFVDGLHFLASIAIELKIEPFNIIWEKKAVDSINLIKNIFLALGDLFKGRVVTSEVFRGFVQDYFQLVINLDFNEAEIVDAFNKKNKLNFKRANTNY